MSLDIDPKLTVRFTGYPLEKIAPRMRAALKVSAKEVERVLADDFVSFTKRELKKNNLGLVPLRATTIDAKKRAGMLQPSTPMYGEGSSDTQSYYSNIVVMESKDGIVVRPSTGVHHGGLTIEKLALIHASGYSRGKTAVPVRNPIRAAAERFKVKDSKFKMMKVIANRFKDIWK